MRFFFLDEFGHDGYYAHKNHKQHGHSPIFGIAGFSMDVDNIYGFIDEFENLLFYYHGQKNSSRIKKGIFQEVKGNEAFPKVSISKNNEYFLNSKNRRNIIFKAERLIKSINKHGGSLLYFGFEKYGSIESHDSSHMHISCIRSLVRKIDISSRSKNMKYQLCFDEHTNHFKKIRIIKDIIKKDSEGSTHIIDRPYSLKSELHSCIQAADWICTILSKCLVYEIESAEWPENKLYYDKLWESVSNNSENFSEFKARQRSFSI